MTAELSEGRESVNVTKVIKYCMEHTDSAEKLFESLSSGDQNKVKLGSEEITLTQGEISEFVERFGSEVESVIWESKRRKYD